MLNADEGNEMQHWDVRMAFTQAVLDEELYIEQPEGFEKDKEVRVQVAQVIVWPEAECL